MCTKVKELATNIVSSDRDSVAERKQISACVRCEDVWIDGGLGWRAALLLDQRREGVVKCREKIS